MSQDIQDMSWAAGVAGAQLSGLAMTLPGCRKPGWSSPLSLVEKRPVSEVARSLRGRPGPGSTSCWPATGPRARRRSSRGRGGRRPHRTRSAADTVELIVRLRKELAGQGLDAGPDTIAWHLAPPPPASTVLPGHDQPVPDPRRAWSPRSRRKRPEVLLHPVRSRACPTRPGSPTSPTTASPTAAGRYRDPDLARRPLPLRPARSPPTHRVTGPIVLATFREAVASHGIPASTLTDNGMVFTTRLAGGQRRPQRLRARAAPPRHHPEELPPNHPTTCGKVERFQQTMKNWLRAQPDQPATITELQALLDAFVDELQPPPPAPLPARTAPPPPPPTPPGPKPPPADRSRRHPRPRPPRPHRQRRHRHPARSTADSTTSASAEPTPEPASSCSSTTSHIRVVNAATGELLRELTLDPTATTSPPADHPAHQTKNTRT